MPALTIAAGALLVLASAVYDLTTLSASVPRWIVIYSWAALTCVVSLFFLWRRGWRGVDHVDGLALALLAYSALSLYWSSDWRQGVMQLTNGAALCAVFMWVRRFPEWIPEACLVALFVDLVLQTLYPQDWGGHGNRNFQTEAIILLVCLSFDVRDKWVRVVWLLVSGWALWFLLFDNPSKIEWAVVPALVLWGWYSGRSRRVASKLRPLAV